MIFIRSNGLTFVVFGCWLSAIYSGADGSRFTTISTLRENQLFPSKDVKKLDGAWSWSQPETTSSVVPDPPQSPPPSFVSGNYFPGHGFNDGLQRGVAKLTEYLPYQYEVDNAAEDHRHHVSSTHGDENGLESITKHFATVSFIGLLLLFAIVQNSISMQQRKDAALSSRKRRDLVVLNGADFTTPEEEEILTEDRKIRCMQLSFCLENQKLRKCLGKTGELLANYLTRRMRNSLDWYRLLEDAGEAGIRGEDCRILYRDCSSFENRRHTRSE